MFEFIHLVDDIVDGYFDAGVYQPHLGELNAMRLFFNYKHPGEEIQDLDIFVGILEDEEFIKSFYQEICHADPYEALNFANAFRLAMEIVNTKKSSLGNLLDLVNNWLSNIGTVLSQENIDKISEIADGIKNGDTAAQLADRVADTLKE